MLLQILSRIFLNLNYLCNFTDLEGLYNFDSDHSRIGQSGVVIIEVGQSNFVILSPNRSDTWMSICIQKQQAEIYIYIYIS